MNKAENHQGDLEPSEPEEIKPGIGRRLYLMAIGIFLILLLLANTDAGIHLINLATGKLVSSRMASDSTFLLKNGGRTIFSKGVADNLSSMYINTQGHEFSACLLGFREGNDYRITGMYFPVTYRETYSSVTSQLCNSSTIISMHSHPPLSCLFSMQDIESYNVFRKINPEGIIALMCDKDVMTFYGYMPSNQTISS